MEETSSSLGSSSSEGNGSMTAGAISIPGGAANVAVLQAAVKRQMDVCYGSPFKVGVLEMGKGYGDGWFRGKESEKQTYFAEQVTLWVFALWLERD